MRLSLVNIEVDNFPCKVYPVSSWFRSISKNINYIAPVWNLFMNELKFNLIYNQIERSRVNTHFEFILQSL